MPELNKRQREILQLVREIYPDDDIGKQIRVVTYELGDLVKCIHKMLRFPHLSSAFRAEAKLALADLIAQLHLTAAYLEFDFDELVELGFRRAKESQLARRSHE